MSEQKFWFLRLGEDDNINYEHAALRYSAISIGFSIGKKLIGMNTREKLKAAGYSEHGQIHDFINVMSKSDIVLMQLRDRHERAKDYDYGIGLIVGDYKPLKYITRNGKLEDPMRPARSIAWITNRLKAPDFEGAVNYLVPLHTTLIEIKKDDGRGQNLIKQIYKVLTQKN